MKRPALTVLGAASLLSVSVIIAGAEVNAPGNAAPKAKAVSTVETQAVSPDMTSIYLHGATAPIWVDVRQVRLGTCGPDGDCTATWQGQSVWARQGDVARARKAVTS